MNWTTFDCVLNENIFTQTHTITNLSSFLVSGCILPCVSIDKAKIDFFNTITILFTVLSNGFALNDTIQFSRAPKRKENESF